TSHRYRFNENSKLVLIFEFEVWNRRKYPVVLVGEKIYFEQVPFAQKGMASLDDDWNVSVGTHRRYDFWNSPHEVIDVFRAKKDVLEPNAHRRFSLSLPCDAGTDNANVWDGRGRANIRVDYFDPIKNKELIIKSYTLKWSTLIFNRGA